MNIGTPVLSPGARRHVGKMAIARRLLPVVLLGLSACNQKPETVTSITPDPMAAEIARRPSVELPPMIKAEATMRCKDNSLVYVTFFTGDELASIKFAKDEPTIRLTAEKAGDPFKAEGYSLTGTTLNITLVRPDKSALTCRR